MFETLAAEFCIKLAVISVNIWLVTMTTANVNGLWSGETGVVSVRFNFTVTPFDVVLCSLYKYTILRLHSNNNNKHFGKLVGLCASLLDVALALPLLRGVDAAKCPSTDGFSAASIPTTNPGPR